MEINKHNFPEIVRDNDDVFISHLLSIIESVDELSCIDISKNLTGYHFRIAPSIPIYIEPVLYEVLKFHNQFGIKLNLSKSMKASSTITFNIDIN